VIKEGNNNGQLALSRKVETAVRLLLKGLQHSKGRNNA